MDEKQRVSWRKVRARGQLRYALLYGGVVWGISLGLFAVAGDFVVRSIKNHFMTSLFLSAPYGKYIFQLTFFYFSGLILGLLMWNRYEREYSKSS